AQALADPAERLGAHLRAPVAVALDPGLELVRERVEAQEEVLRGAQLGGRPAELAARRLEDLRLEEVAAALALVAGGVLVSAMRASAYDETIRQEPLVLEAVELLLRALGHEPVLVDVREERARRLVV